MTSSRISLAACFVALAGAVMACAAVIDIGDPALESSDAAAAPPVEASTPRDTSTVPQDASAPEGVACGSPTTLCGGGTPVCCTYHFRSGGYKYLCAATCAPPDSTEDFLATLKCTRFSDCPNQRCCARTSLSSASSTCKPSCADFEYLLCDPPPAANTCPDGYDECQAFSNGFSAAFGYCPRK